ncbi:DEAD/DEAH box helicase [Salininema proteolyticum]|uniref:DEAD/DEAH box helicase n=1 Tax=Salininema proteolyticum TaxID=1607685 RepID=A0ABV8U4P4_9ACTN
MTTTYTAGSLVTTRGRDWIVLPESEADMLVLRPLGGGEAQTTAVFPDLEAVEPAEFSPPSSDDIGDAVSAGLLRTALQIGFHSAAGPFRSLAGLNVEPRAYQLVPLLMALREDTVRLLIGDDVGIGKTVEAGLIAKELLTEGNAKRLSVLCSPALAEQWQQELRTKFNINAELVLPSTISRLNKTRVMGESLFEKYPHTVISTDFIKSDRHWRSFLDEAPDLVIVDEAHSCVTSDENTSVQAQKRYRLLEALSKDENRHMILLTATPHSGKETGFRNLVGLLRPHLAEIDLAGHKGREELAEYFVQRRREDIRRYLDQDNEFPADREFKQAEYSMTPSYKEFFDDVLEYARGRYHAASDSLGRRKTWWDVLGLLRAVVSSPAAAGQALSTRSAVSIADSESEADKLGEPIAHDYQDGAVGDTDQTPGAVAADEGDPEANRLIEAAVSLTGPDGDAKLARLIKDLKKLIKAGHKPIVFCHYVSTARYVYEHVKDALGKNTAVAEIDGVLSPQQRVGAIDKLADEVEENGVTPVLIATDCLSEGVNLQQLFDAVVHYDLAWNPTRLDQREGRVDRFGQKTDIVRVITMIGDNGMDGKILEVLINKHRQIRKTLGINVPVPDEQSATVGSAVAEWIVLRGEEPEQDTLFDFDSFSADWEAQALQEDALKKANDSDDAEWQSTREQEKSSRAIYAARRIHPDEVHAEVGAIRDSLGDAHDVSTFLHSSLGNLSNGSITLGSSGDFKVNASELPASLRDAMGVALGRDLGGSDDHVWFRSNPAVPRGEAAIVRTDPVVNAIGEYVLNTALDPALSLERRPARRAGAIRTGDVDTRTTLFLVRYRFNMTHPTRHGERRSSVAEDARLLAFRGAPSAPTWLNSDEVDKLLLAKPAANIDPAMRKRTVDRILQGLPDLDPAISELGDSLAGSIEDSYVKIRHSVDRKARSAGTRSAVGLSVTPQKPADVLGLYVYLPVSGGAK